MIIDNNMAINLFDFSKNQSQSPRLNFWLPMSWAWITNYQDLKPVTQPKPTTPTSGGFSIIQKANASESMFDTYMNDPNISKQGKFKMLQDIQSWNITEQDADEIIKWIYWQTQPTQQVQPQNTPETEKNVRVAQWLMESLKWRFEQWTEKRKPSLIWSIPLPILWNAERLQKTWALWGAIWDIWWAIISTLLPADIKEKADNIFGKDNVDYALNKIQSGWQAYELAKKENPSLFQYMEDVANTTWILWGWPTWAKWAIKAWKWVVKWAEKIADTAKNLSEKLKTVKVDNATKQIERWEDILFEAVNPTTRENKAVLKQRVQDLLPYIDNNPLKNSLEDVKARIDTVKTNAGKSMEDYEINIGVKWNVETAPIIKKLKEKYQEKIWDSFINADEAKMSQQLIDTLKWFWDNVKDADIIKIRRAWDKIIEKNKWFMQSADANSKWDIFADANKFFREEIKKSNPEYAKYLNDYHKSTTLSDVLDATIQRRVWQQKGWFIKKWLEIWARVTWAWTWWLPGYLATEALIQWANVLSWPGFKLTRWAKLLKKGKKALESNKTKNGVDSNASNSSNNNSVWRGVDKTVKVLSDREKALIKSNKEQAQKPKTLIKSPLSERERKLLTKTQLETTLKWATTSNIDEVTQSVAKTLKTTKTAEIKAIIQRYLKEFWKDFKNKIGEMIDDIIKKTK